jgi:hypothetical protein
MGRKHRGGVKKKAAAARNCPDCADPRYWCVAHLLEDGGLDCDGVDPSEGAPGFHAYYTVPESSEQTPEHSNPQHATEQPAREKAEALGPMMENFDTFLDYYEPTDEQVSLGSLLLSLGSLEAHGQAAEAGIDF